MNDHEGDGGPLFGYQLNEYMVDGELKLFCSCGSRPADCHHWEPQS